MGRSCFVVGCKSSSRKSPEITFHRIPAIITEKNKRYQRPGGKYTLSEIIELSKIRQRAWIRALRRGDLTESQLKNAKICGHHFLSGQTVDLLETDHPDWVPCIKLGYKYGKAVKRLDALKRHERQVKREREENRNNENIYFISNLSAISPIAKKCCIKNCATEFANNDQNRRQLFKFPTDVKMKNKWLKSIGENLITELKYRRNHFLICNLHFADNCFYENSSNDEYDDEIPRKILELKSNSIPTIFKVPLQQTTLTENAIPTSYYQIPEKNINNNIHDDHSYNKTVILRENANLTFVEMAKPSTNNSKSPEPLANSSELPKPTANVSKLPETSANVSKPSESPANVSEPSESSAKNSKNPKISENITKLPETFTENEVEIIEEATHIQTIFNSSLSFEFIRKPCEIVDESSCFINIEKPWNLNVILNDKKKLLFNYVVSLTKDNVCRHVFEKSVIIDEERRLQYEVYSTPVNLYGTGLPKVVQNIKNIPNILKVFQRFPICKGIGTLADNSFPLSIKATDSLYSGDVWRHKHCALLSNGSERCTACRKSLNSWAAREQRLKRQNEVKAQMQLSETAQATETLSKLHNC